MRASAILFFMILIVAGCNNNNEEKCEMKPDTEGITINIKIERLEDSLIHGGTKQALVDFLRRHPIIRDQFLQRNNYPDDSAFVNQLYRRFNSPHIDTLLLESKRVFSDLSTLRAEFEEAFKNFKYYYPHLRLPKIQTVVTGFDHDLFVSDSLIIVGLDYYLGKTGKYRPNTYEYILRQYEPENIVPSCMLIYGIGRLNKTNLNDKTVLADMISYGKAFYFAKRLQPCKPDSTLIWYSAQDIQAVRANEDLIWKKFIENEVLYNTSHVIKQKYIEERPKVVEISAKCPGRIAQWVGWQIVKKYMAEHPNVSLPQLMETGDADKIFKESHYRPE